MQRVLAHVLAAVFGSVLLLAVSSLAVYADANPANRGHHYGQLKHRQTQTPIPAPNPNPNPNRGSSGAPAAAPQSLHAVTLPALKLVPVAQTSAQVKPAAPHAPAFPWWWLVLVLPPALAALWLVAARRVGLALAPAAAAQAVPRPA